jgi:hypothetical protein
VLEEEAVRRAYHGTERPIFQKGVQVGSVKEFSDSLLMFLLKSRDPRVPGQSYRRNDWRRRGPIKTEGGLDLTKLSTDELQKPLRNRSAGSN